MAKKFQSTLSMRRATPLMLICGALLLFQSTLSMRRATSWWTTRYVTRTISIHALHEESDKSLGADPDQIAISIHALHEESDTPT